MNLSSILVTTSHPYFDTTLEALSSIDGIELHYCDKEGSQIIVTQEAPNTESEMQGLQHIKSLPHVVMAEMVYHYCEEDSES